MSVAARKGRFNLFAADDDEDGRTAAVWEGGGPFFFFGIPNFLGMLSDKQKCFFFSALLAALLLSMHTAS